VHCLTPSPHLEDNVCNIKSVDDMCCATHAPARNTSTKSCRYLQAVVEFEQRAFLVWYGTRPLAGHEDLILETLASVLPGMTMTCKNQAACAPLVNQGTCKGIPSYQTDVHVSKHMHTYWPYKAQLLASSIGTCIIRWLGYSPAKEKCISRT
jgi:hypothetical protein